MFYVWWPRANIFMNAPSNLLPLRHAKLIFFSRKHGLMNYTDIKTKCHLKKLTFKGTFRQVLVYRLEIYSVTLVYSTKLCELLPL